MGPINDIPALVPIMAWRRPGYKPLSEPMMISLLMHICITRPQWVNWTSVGMLSIGNIVQWNLYQNTLVFIQANIYKDVCKKVDIFSLPQCQVIKGHMCLCVIPCCPLAGSVMPLRLYYSVQETCIKPYTVDKNTINPTKATGTRVQRWNHIEAMTKWPLFCRRYFHIFLTKIVALKKFHWN